MARLVPHLEHDERQYIDPRLLEQTGGGVTAPLYNNPAVQPTNSDALEVELDIDLEYQPHDIKDVCNVPQAAHSSYLRFDDVGFSPLAAEDTKELVPNLETAEFDVGRFSRPQLVLKTEQQDLCETDHVDVSPTTPQIEIQPPENVGHGANSGIRRPIQNNGRLRRRSSPGRRPPKSSVREADSEYRTTIAKLGSGERLLSPSTVQRWINGDAYHPGDSLALPRHRCTPDIPASPPSVCSAAPSPSPSGQTRRSYYCDHEGCKKAEKPWDTRSELRKHQRIHLPKDQRPHGCPECDEAFWYPKDVARHINAKHKEEAAAVCPFCNKSLSREDNLERHIERRHSISLQTRPSVTGSSFTSPVPSSICSFSEMCSDTPPSTALTSPLSQMRSVSRSFRGRTLLPAIFDDQFMDSDDLVPTSVPMTRGHTR